MKHIIVRSLRRLLPAATIYVPCCMIIGALATMDVSPREIPRILSLWIAALPVFAWKILLLTTAPSGGARILLMLPVRTDTWAWAAWIRDVALPWCLVFALGGIYMVLKDPVECTGAKGPVLGSMVLWLGLAFALIPMHVLRSAPAMKGTVQMCVGVVLVVLLLTPLLLSDALTRFTEADSAWRTLLPDHPAGLVALAIGCALGLTGSLLSRKNVFIASLNPPAARPPRRNGTILSPRFAAGRRGLPWMYTSPMLGAFATVAAYTALICGIMLWAMPPANASYGLCFIMTVPTSMDLWGRNWRAMTRVETILPTSKRRNAGFAVLLTSLAVCIPLLALVLTYSVRGVVMRSESDPPGRFYFFQPLLLGTTLVYAALDMSRVWPSRLFGGIVTTIGAGVTMGFFLVLSEWTGPFVEPCLLLSGCLAVIVGVGVMLRLVRRALDDSSFYKRGVTE